MNKPPKNTARKETNGRVCGSFSWDWKKHSVPTGKQPTFSKDTFLPDRENYEFKPEFVEE